jgi:hypothetical protein
MRKWGILISIFYALILLVFIVPISFFVGGDPTRGWGQYFSDVRGGYSDRLLWLLITTLLGSQVLPLFLSVDTSHKRLKPRAHVLISITLGALLTAILTTGAIWSLAFAIRGDKLLTPLIIGRRVCLVLVVAITSRSFGRSSFGEGYGCFGESSFTCT